MARVLALHPDTGQARVLRVALQELRRAEVVVVNSKESALAAIDREVPDLVLLPDLTSPTDDEHLMAYLDVMPGAEHVQVLRIPSLRSPSDAGARKPSGFGRFSRRVVLPVTAGCDPRVFAQDVAAYLEQAQQLRQERAWGRLADTPQAAAERRGARRWSPLEVPWVRSVRFVTETAANLINLSTGGALLWTEGRPDWRSLRRNRRDVESQSGLMLRLASGEEVSVGGCVVRCQVRSMPNGLAAYEVGFQFAEENDAPLRSHLEIVNHW